MADNSYNIMVSNPVTPFTMSRSFKACSNGKIFIGQPDTDPTFPQNQIPVYVEGEGGSTIQVPQPIRINIAGYPVYHGQVAKFVTTQNYSMAVYDSYMVQQFYWPDLASMDPNALRKELTTVGDGQAADMIPLEQGGTVADALSGIYTPEMWGCVGDGSTSDRKNFQKMLDEVPTGATITCKGGANYYNDMAGTGADSESWTITKPVTLNLNGATLSKLASVKGQDQSGVLIINGVTTGRVRIKGNGGLIDGGNPIDYPYNNSLVQQTSRSKTSICQSIDYGVLVKNSTDVDIDCDVTRCAFPTWYTGCKRVKSRGRVSYAGQVYNNISATDLAYGAGVKVSDTSFFDIKVAGNNNANATLEIESDNSFGICKTISEDNLSSAMTIVGTTDLIFDVVANNCGVGIQLISNADGPCRNISGRAVSNGSTTYGHYVGVTSGATGDSSNINIHLTSYKSSQFGLYVECASTLHSMITTKIDYHGDSNYQLTSGGYPANDVVIKGDFRGEVIGESANIYNGVYISGTNSQAYPPRVAMTLRQGLTSAFAIASGSYADVSGTKTATQHIVSKGSNITTISLLRMASGGGDAAVTDWVAKASHNYFSALPTSYSFNYEIYADTNTTLNTNEKYLKVRIPS